MTRLAALTAGAVAIALVQAAPALAAAESSAEESSIFSTTLLPLALAVIMVSLGLSLTPADFARVLQVPEGRRDRPRQPAGDLATAGLRHRLAVGLEAGAGGRPGAARRVAGRHDGQPAHPRGSRRHRAVGHDDRDQQRRSHDHRPALPRAGHRPLRRELRERPRDARRGRQGVPHHGGAALDRHVDPARRTELGDARRGARQADRARPVRLRRGRQHRERERGHDRPLRASSRPRRSG